MISLNDDYRYFVRIRKRFFSVGKKQYNKNNSYNVMLLIIILFRKNNFSESNSTNEREREKRGKGAHESTILLDL